MMLTVEMGEPFVWSDLEFVALTVLDDVLTVEMGEPFVWSDLEFVALTVHGQSFMQHQIRKMIG